MLTAQSLLNAAGALAFVLVGAFALAVAKGSRRAQFVGVASISFGAPLVLSNLFFEASIRFLILQSAAELVTTAGASALAWHLVKDLPRRRPFFLAATLLAAGVALLAAIGLRDPAAFEAIIPGTGQWLAINLVAFAMAGAGLMLVAAAAALRLRAHPDVSSRERRALALTAVAFGAYPLFYLAPLHGFYLQTAWPWLSFVGVSLLWTGAGPTHDSRPAMWTSLALHACAVGGLIFWGPLAAATQHTVLDDYGVPGVLRTVCALLLLLAILRYDLLGAPLPALSVRRGPLAATALAALLIVAQLAENVLETQYGLLLGSVVAGALLFAARPIERALDGRSRGPAAERLDVYRDAVRAALRDGPLSRDEEIHLAKLARHMGVGHDDAVRVRHELEDEGRGAQPA